MRTTPKSLAILSFFLLILMMWSCGGNNSTCQYEVDLSEIENPEINIIRLEDELFKLKSPAEVLSFLKKYPDFNKQYLLKQFPSDSIAAQALFQMVEQKEIRDTLYPHIQKRFADVSDLQSQFSDAFRHVKYYFPDTKIPKIYTTITGLGSFYGSDLYVGQDMIVISLDLFSADSAVYRPPVEQLPDYIWKRQRREYIVSNSMLVLSNAFNQTDMENKTLLAEMVYYGKSYQFVKMMMPCTPDSIITGYTTQDIANLELEENKKFIWGHFIEKDLLYSTKNLDKTAYLSERPYTAEINAKAPGRIGRWLGWKIVQKYLQEKEVTLPALMDNANAQKIFTESSYKGD